MQELLKKKNVVAFIPGHKVVAGVDTGRDAMVVYVTEKVPLRELSKEDIVPKRIKGLESDVQVSTKIDALSRTDKYRPMPGGVSGSHPDVTSGTINPFKPSEIMYLISNKHVTAPDGADLGDQTWQPGSFYGGGPADTVGHIIDIVPVHYAGDSDCLIMRAIIKGLNFLARGLGSSSTIPNAISTPMNKVDVALSKPIDEKDILEEILGIGKPAGFNFNEVTIGAAVKKSGATSEVTHGTILGSGGVATVNYGDKVAVFTDQIFTTAIASPGDSGSLVLNSENEIIGLLFAGSDTLTIVNKISNVLAALAKLMTFKLKGGSKWEA